MKFKEGDYVVAKRLGMDEYDKNCRFYGRLKNRVCRITNVSGSGRYISVETIDEPYKTAYSYSWRYDLYNKRPEWEI